MKLYVKAIVLTLGLMLPPGTQGSSVVTTQSMILKSLKISGVFLTFDQHVLGNLSLWGKKNHRVFNKFTESDRECTNK